MCFISEYTYIGGICSNIFIVGMFSQKNLEAIPQDNLRFLNIVSSCV